MGVVSMSELGWVVLVTTLAGVGGTGMGGVMSALFKKRSEKIVSLLLSFAAGVMLSVVCFDLISEALHVHEGGDASRYLPLVICGVMLGYGVIALLNWWIDKSTNHEVSHIDEAHPRTADALDELIHADHFHEHKESNTSLFLAGVIMASAIALHNLPEGMVIGAAYASGGEAASLVSGSGFIMALVIGLHNVPEGMAVAVPLIAGGMPRGRAIFVTAASGAPTVLGALLGYSLGTMGPVWLSLSLSFASGAMLYVVLGELMPEAILIWRSKLPAFSILIGILTGLLIIYV